jgi:cholesterol oxidase
MSPDVIVVGSGFGGAVSAARLAQRGFRVLILERGPWWGPAGDAQPAADRRAFPRGVRGLRKSVRSVRWARGKGSREVVVARDGLYEMHAFEHLDVVTGSGVGGGSLIYTNVLEQPPDDFFAAFPDEITADEMRPWFDRVRAVLRPSPIPIVPEKNRAFAQATEAAGFGAPVYPDLAIAWSAGKNAAGVAQSGCTHCGCCVMGCTERAKTTLDLTYVPIALQNGAELRPLCEVVGLGREAGRYIVRYRDHRSGSEHHVAAPRLILAAGSMNTIRLLFQARDRHGTLPYLPPALGRHFSPNGDLLAIAGDTQTVADVGRGAALNAFVRRDRFIVGEVGLPLAAMPLPRSVRRRLGRTALLLAMGRDASTGELTYDGGALRTTVGRDLDPSLFAEIEDAIEAVGRPYSPARLFMNVPSGRGAPRIGTVHPLGGASIGRGPEEGVVDHTGEVFGNPGLFIADGALYPRSPGIPPSLTIAALAERQANMMP